MTRAKVIGLVLHYRDARRTAACISSLVLAGVDHVLAWDNTEDGGESAAALKLMLDPSMPCTVATSNRNLGFAAGVNRGLEWITGHWPGAVVLLINNDAILQHDALSKLLDAHESHPDARVIYPRVDHGGWVRGTVYYHPIAGLITDQKLPGSFAYASGCCLLINLPVTGTSLFDEDFFMYGEDWELGWRLSKLPGAMVHVPLTLVLHEVASGSGLGTEFYEARTVAGHILLAKKLVKAADAPRFQSVFIRGVLLVRALVRSVRYRSLAPLRALSQGADLARI